MQRYQSNGEGPYQGDQSLPQEDVGTGPTERLFPPYDEVLPPLPQRSSHRPYQPPIHERPSSSPDVAYDVEPEPARPPANTLTFSIAKFNQFLAWLLSVIEVMFTLRFFLTFFATSTSNAFISLLTSLTDPLLAPFKTALQVQDNGVERSEEHTSELQSHSFIS